MLRIRVLLLCLAAALLLTGCVGTPVPTEPPYTLPPSAFSVGDFAFQGEYLACTAAPARLGVDVSHHQGDIDWTQVKAAGMEFAIVRLGYRGLTEGKLDRDKKAEQNLAGARSAGLLVGAYFYSQATSAEEAAQEAAYALEILGDFPLDLPLVFDWEIEQRTQTVPPDTAAACAIAFCEAVTAAGYSPMVYFNGYQAKNRVDMEQLEGYPWWLAQYDLTQEFPCRMAFWQYTDQGRVAGIQGDVDINLWLE